MYRNNSGDFAEVSSIASDYEERLTPPPPYEESQEDFLTQEAYEKLKRDYEIAKQTIRNKESQNIKLENDIERLHEKYISEEVNALLKSQEKLDALERRLKRFEKLTELQSGVIDNLEKDKVELQEANKIFLDQEAVLKTKYKQAEEIIETQKAVIQSQNEELRQKDELVGDLNADIVARTLQPAVSQQQDSTNQRPATILENPRIRQLNQPQPVRQTPSLNTNTSDNDDFTREENFYGWRNFRGRVGVAAGAVGLVAFVATKTFK